ncbi:transmembrane protein 17-like isoform X2 [Chelonus insularis]|uniref:transmembrane protein 17-like isoform X2 n=1 Tax=Chelonus insularis TaxID=460826 RepID=UPI00158D75DE|nr:transmembrane protein 17-like isoform X2 [Chelonus insularis]
MWKYKVVSVSNHIFPGLMYYDRDKKFYDTGNLIKSNVLLQMVLYFNVWLFPIWFFIMFLGLDAKYYNLSNIYRCLNISTYTLISIIECIKLYLGYIGNLSEKIPELASFWFISTLLQFPLLMFILLEGNMLSYFIEKITTGMMITLLSIEIMSCTMTLNNIAAHNLKQFYASQICNIDKNSNGR